MNLLGSASTGLQAAQGIMNQGSSAINLIQKLGSQSPRNKKILDYAMSQGMSPDDIAMYMSGGQGMTESQRSDVGRKVSQKENLSKLLNAIKQTAQIAATGYGTYKLIQSAAPIAGSIAKAAMGMPQQRNIAQAAMGVSSSGAAMANAGATAPTAAQTVSKAAKGASFSGLMSQIAGVFGLKNKKAIESVAKIVEETGKDVKQVYNEMAKEFDISTPEKATKAAAAKLKELTGEGTIVKPKDIVASSNAAKEKLKNAKTIGDVTDELAKDMGSSVIRKMHWNRKDKTLEVIFNSGSRYHYYDFPKSEFNKLRKGATPAKTSGENEYGIWWVGKNPSLGATYNKVIQPHLREKGPYKYERKSSRPLSEEEESEFLALQTPQKAALKKIQNETKAIGEKAKESFKERKASLSADQLRDRTRVLNKQLDTLKSKPPSQRKNKTIDLIEKRLRDIEDYDKMRAEIKSKVVKGEAIRLNEHEGKTTINKLISLLPAALIKVVKKRMETMDEASLLEFIKNQLVKK